MLHNSCTGVYLHLTPTPRAVPLIDEKHCAGVVHSSVFARRSCPPITVGEYRPSRMLAVGESVSCQVFAGEMWNASGLYLEEGHYSFQAHGEWLDRGIAVGPDGTRDGRFQPAEVFHLMGSIAGWGQKRFRQLSGNEAATFFGTPRADAAPWMALIAVVAATELDANGAQKPYRPLVIGQASKQTGGPARLLVRLRQRRLGPLRQQQGLGHDDSHPARLTKNGAVHPFYRTDTGKGWAAVAAWPRRGTRPNAY